MAETVSETAVLADQSDPLEGLHRYTLTAQFLITGSVVLLMGMLAIGFWVTKKIEDGVTRNTAAATALYMESFVAPRVQELARVNRVSPETQRVLDNLLHANELGRRIVSFKIWKEGGLIAYSSHASIIGTTYPVTPELQKAWKGEVSAEFGGLDDEEDAPERAANRPLLEIYSPVRETNTGRIMAVAEFYETADELEQNLFMAKLQSWLVVGGATLLMLAALSGIVVRGSRTIERQRTQLQARVKELSNLLNQNEYLRSRLQTSSNRVAELNERYLRRIGADLHDGPAQLIGFALLRLDSLRSALRKEYPERKDPDEIGAVYDALHEAMGEIRELSAGLTLAKLEEMSPLTVLKEIVGAHERRTETRVVLTVDSIPENLPLPLKISVFRFVQEALNNAYRHGGGIDQNVTCRIDGSEFELNVSDGGPGFMPETPTGEDSGMGLIGLRERIESLGATLKIESTPGEGTILTMRCRLSDGGSQDD
jgi:signal transduction histidine kinase